LFSNVRKMANPGGHRDRGYVKWWVILGVVFVVAIGTIYLGPFVASPRSQEELESPPTSITEAETATENSSGQQPPAEQEQTTKNVSIAEDSPSRGAEEVAPETDAPEDPPLGDNSQGSE
jgi:cytoskeletal protein RodZ